MNQSETKNKCKHLRPIEFGELVKIWPQGFPKWFFGVVYNWGPFPDNYLISSESGNFDLPRAMIFVDDEEPCPTTSSSQVSFPIVKNVYGHITANDITSVQPMTVPQGLGFYMDFKSSSESSSDATNVMED